MEATPRNHGRHGRCSSARACAYDLPPRFFRCFFSLTPRRFSRTNRLHRPSRRPDRRLLVRKTGEADHPVEAAPRPKSPDDSVLLHGFRLGYGYVFNYSDPSSAFENKSFQERAGLRSPHHFLLGYEVVYRVVGHSWLNVLLIGNGMIAGLEQSKVLPSGNLLIGAEIKNSFQIGVGANVSPLKGSEAHTIIAAGWTPRVGTIYTPVHAYFIPDVDGYHRMGMTTGVTF